MKTVIALFRTYEDANRAVDALREAGVTRDAISVLVRQEILPGVMGPDAGPIDRSHPPLDAPKVADSVGAGAVSGGLVGGLTGLLVGLGAIVIPGIGPIIAAGALGSAIAGAGLGLTAGGLLGMLGALDLKEDQASAYVEGINRGGVLVSVLTGPEMTPAVQSILTLANGQQVGAWEASSGPDLGAVQETQE